MKTPMTGTPGLLPLPSADPAAASVGRPLDDGVFAALLASLVADPLPTTVVAAGQLVGLEGQGEEQVAESVAGAESAATPPRTPATELSIATAAGSVLQHAGVTIPVVTEPAPEQPTLTEARPTAPGRTAPVAAMPAPAMPGPATLSPATLSPAMPATVVPVPVMPAPAVPAVPGSAEATTTDGPDLAAAAADSTAGLPGSPGTDGAEPQVAALRPRSTPPTPGSTPAPPVSVDSALTSVSAPTAATASTPVSEAAPAPGSPADQVSRVLEAQVARVTQRGDGTHRMTLTLYPAALGEVQVTLTMRGGAVTVALAAGAEARATLAADSAQLQRVLGRVMTGPAEISIHALTAAAQAPEATSASGQPQTGQSPAGQADQHPTGSDPDARSGPEHGPADPHHARTRGGPSHAAENATDGVAQEHPGTPGSPSNRSGTRPPSGVDVTM